MKPEPFDKMDAEWMERLRPLRDKKLPESVHKDIAGDVVWRLREARDEKETVRQPVVWRWAPVAVPAFAVLVMALSIALRPDAATRVASAPVPERAFAVAAATPQEITDEISVLMELGEWTEEDDAAVLTDEESLSNPELTRKTSGVRLG